MFFSIVTLFLLINKIDSKTLTFKHCTGGVIFLNSDNYSYKIPFKYECNNDLNLQNKINNLKIKINDPYVSYYLSENNNNNNNRFKRVILEGSGNGNHGDDNDNNYDEEEEEEEEIEEEIEEIFPVSHVVPIMPTPTIEFNIVSTIATSTDSVATIIMSEILLTDRIQPTRSYSIINSKYINNDVFIGSGSGPILTTPIISMPTIVPIETTTTSMTTEKSVKRVKLQKSIVPAGSKYEQKIEKNCSELRLVSGLLPNWIEFNNKSLIALPSNEDVSDYEFELTCEDIIYEIYLSVRQRQKSRNWNHYFRIEYGTVERTVESFIKFIEFIRNSTIVEDLIILKNSGKNSFPYFVEFVNETIVSSSTEGCPVGMLKSTLENLEKLKKTSYPSYSIKNVNLKRLNQGNCDQEDFNTIDNDKKNNNIVNYGPTIKNPIDRINGVVGKYLIYKIKQDFCYDPEDGETNRLKLSIKNLKDFSSYHENFWMQFDWKNQEIYGLPMNKQTLNSVIVCEDRGGKTAQDVLEVVIVPNNSEKKYSAEFSLHFESIPFTPSAIKKFIEKLSSILSDEIEVKSFSESNHHVHFKWYNTSNPSSELELTQIRKILFADEGGVQKNIKLAFSPEFNLTSSGGVVPVGGVLLGGQSPVENNNNNNKYFDFDKESVVNSDVNSQEENNNINNNNWMNFDITNSDGEGSVYLTTYIIPSILIAVMILLAIIIACLLSRKRKTNNDDDDNYDGDERKNFVGQIKGQVPVIFQEELDFQQQQLKPQQQLPQQPQQPPNYNQIRQQQQQPPQFHHHPNNRFNNRAGYDNNPPSYQPPPALYNTSNNRNNPPLYHSNNRFHHQNQPYVPP